MMIKQNDDTGSYLTAEELKEVSQVTDRAPDQDLTWASVFPIRGMANPDAETDKFFVAETDEGAAELLSDLESAPAMAISNQRVTYNIYNNGIGFSLALIDIRRSRSWGSALDTEYIARAKRKVDEKSNALAYIGDSKYGVPGVLSTSGVTAITGTVWSSTVDIANDVISMVNQLPVVYRKRPYSLVLADAEYVQLEGYFNGTGNIGDRSHFERIKSALPNLSIYNEINLDAATVLYDASTVAAGTALLIPNDATLVKIKVARSPEAITATEVVDEVLKGKVKARIGVVETPFPTAIGKITGLQ